MSDRPAEAVDELALVKATFHDSARYGHLVLDTTDEEVAAMEAKF